MKKTIALLSIIASVSVAAAELQIKGGYDFERGVHGDVSTSTKLEDNWVAGLEFLPDNQGEFEWGIGAEYKWNSDLEFADDSKLDGVEMIPVYATGKYNMWTTDSGSDALYLIGRVGYSFNNGGDELDELSSFKVEDGLYMAAGLGTEFGPVVLEGLYERTDVDFSYDGSSAFDSKNYVESYGARLGYRLGNTVNDRKPTVIEKVVTETITVPGETKYIETIKEVPAAPTPKTVALPFSCNASQKKCIIRGFKVDGREPDAQEQSDLRAISTILNFAGQTGAVVDVVGHTDSTGAAAYNQKLSVERAQNVARLLRQYGLDNMISYGSITGKGETTPSDTNETKEGKYNNRRVELFLNGFDWSKIKIAN